jgi:hypothetical protein
MTEPLDSHGTEGRRGIEDSKFRHLVVENDGASRQIAWSYSAGYAIYKSPSRRGQMLRIERSANGEAIIKLIGRIDNENIAEVEAIIGAEPGGKNLVLDLKDVTLAGQEGVRFFGQCETAGIALANCPAYIREWITRERSGE